MGLISEGTLTEIGTDPRWLFCGLKLKTKSKSPPPKSMLEEMLESRLGEEMAVELFPGARRLVITSRQIAIRQHLSRGINTSLAPDDDNGNSRNRILSKIQRLLGVQKGHANRVLNGLGIFTVEDDGTDQLVRHYVGRNTNFVRELDADLIQLLACGAGERLDSLMQHPFVFWGNSACAAIRLKYKREENESVVDAKVRIKDEYPPIFQTSIDMTKSVLNEPNPQSDVALYGLAMWYGMQKILRSREGAALEGQHIDPQNIIRLVTTDAPWIFPELAQIKIDSYALLQLKGADEIIAAQARQRDRLKEAQHDSRYLAAVGSAIQRVGLAVGKAICSVRPYTLEIGEELDAVS